MRIMDLEFYGVMRFYFQDAGQKVATKCMRISSTASTADVINNLIEKFRPDIRMLSVPEYALYEIHENGEERKLADSEFPLLVQLNWHKDDREGRFLLRRMDEKTYLPGFSPENSNIFNRKLSKREKKEKKKKEKKEKAANNSKSNKDGGKNGKDSLAEKLYTELPETSFTRSISNPEAVMRRRRQQKLEKKLQQFSQEGGPEAGGTLRIFGESINQDVPYKTILLSTRDTASFAVKEILEKYGKDKEDPAQYCLVQVIVPYLNNGSISDATTNGVTNGPQSLPDTSQTGIREYILDDDDCPLIIERSHNKSRGVLTFHIRRRPPDFQPRRRKKKIGNQMIESIGGVANAASAGDEYCESTTTANKMLPYLVEVDPDGNEIFRQGVIPKRHYLNTSILEIGTDVDVIAEKSSNPNLSTLQLYGPSIQPHHCTIANTDGIIIVTPSNREAEVFINGTKIYETTVLKPGMLVRFGKLSTFKFVDENLLKRHSQISAGPSVGHHSQQLLMNDPLKSPTSSLNPSYETTFDADGKVETSSKPEPVANMYNTGSLQRHQTLGSLPRSSIASNIETNMMPIRQVPGQLPIAMNNQPQIRKGDNILPAILEVGEELEDLFLTTIIKRIDPNQVQFKLCITYSLYMVTRYRASTYFKPEITPEIRAELLIAFCIKYANMIQRAINENHTNQSSLAFWLANSSEILHFLKNDRHLSAFTFDSQDIMAESVQIAFNLLVACQQNELQEVLSTFTKDIVDQSNNAMDTMTQNILKVLSNSMQLLRRFRVNAALTIQLFSQLFHFINMWLFNKVIGTPESNFCSRVYGIKLKQCLAQIELWAEKQGLELAAECHLSRIIQTALFLQGPKKCPEDLNALVANFYKLNSIQLRALCERYQPLPDEVSFTSDNIQNMVKMARNTTDELIIKDGREIRLEEESDLQLPFLLPEDGYSCDIVRGIPTGLQEFVQTLVQARICSLTIQPTASGYWTIYFINFQADQQTTPTSIPYQEYDDQKNRGSISDKNSLSSQFVGHPQLLHGQQQSKTLPPPIKPLGIMMAPGYGPASAYGTVRMMPEPEVHVIKLQKINNGIGLSIVAARGTNQTQSGIYIKSVVKGGAADMDGRLEAGDQLLKVDGQTLIGITQEKAAELMTQTGPVVTLEIAKQGALYHGLGGILTQQQQVPSAAAAAMMAKNLRLRFAPDYGGIHRFPGAATTAGQYSPMLSQFPTVAASQQTGMPGYNSLPLPLNYNYRNQMGTANVAAAGTTIPLTYNNNSVNSMRPESQLSYNSATNLMNSSLVNNNNRNINMSTASLPANAAAVQHFHQLPEERHYQNIQLYQLNHPGSATQPNGPGQISSMQKLSPNMNHHQLHHHHQIMPPPSSVAQVANRSILHGSHSSLQQHPSSLVTTTGELTSSSNPSRPVSAIVTTREQEQIFAQNAAAVSGSVANTVKRPGEHYYSQQSQSSDPNQTLIEQQFRQHQLRQEAKMEEIREELRRREDRIQQQQLHGGSHTMSRGVSMSNSAITPHVLMTTNGNSLRPRFTSQQSLTYNGQSMPQPSTTVSQSSLNGFRPNGPFGSPIRSNPPPPAPKPMRSMASNNNNNAIQHAQQPNYRYGPSGYPPLAQAKSSSPSPWEREEKEKEIQQKIEETKRSRDDEIKHLESLPYRNPKNEEHENDDQKKADTAQRLKYLRIAEEQTLPDEEKILPDVKKRQEESPSKMNNKSTYDYHSETIPPLPKSSPPVESANQRLDRLLLNVMKNDENDQQQSTSQQQQQHAIPEDEPQEDRFSLQDIDDVLGSQGPNGKNWLNNYVSGSTPGVIGAQEVYNDPRKRIEAERFKSNQNQSSTDKLPEKLTFQEKMKMFAKTTGAPEETPVRSKVKISKAQREIEDRDSTTTITSDN
ncbi:Mllt4p [Dermatophagoides pteronyssinus]|uniref:Mllt4p n=1 Tax=Dermatophagoides pteronyssinus TaxID=6956 RepID=A0ABQ8JSJ9_DERPT|nr:Mllt4p [Dermatophagoides pteronyssinus]